MPGPIPLGDIPTASSPFDLLAVLLGTDGPRTVRTQTGSAVVTTLALADASGATAELTLWGILATRSASLRVLDIVHVQRANRADPHPRAPSDPADIRLRLRGDGSVQRARDTEPEVTDLVQWRNRVFGRLAKLARVGAVRTRDIVPSPGFFPQGAYGGRQESRIRHVDNIDVSSSTSRQDGLVTAASTTQVIEVSGVRVNRIWVRAGGTRTGDMTDVVHALQAGVYRGCSSCDTHADSTREVCAKCYADVRWRFDKLAVELDDGSQCMTAAVRAENVSTLLLGVRAVDVRAGGAGLKWAEAALGALVADGGPFVAVVRGTEQDAAKVGHGVGDAEQKVKLELVRLLVS